MGRQRRRSFRLLALVAGLSLVAASCGDDSDGDGEEAAAEEEGADLDEEGLVTLLEDVCATDAEADEPAEPGEGLEGGEFVDVGTFVSDPPSNIDPVLNTTSNAAQVIQATFDGLTAINYTDDGPEAVGKVAESWEVNEAGDVWTFQLREGLRFSNGEPVLPSSFVCSWERASFPGMPSYYAYLFNFIEGGAEKLTGEAETMTGLVADDEALTLEVTLDEPYAAFDMAVNHTTFYPVPNQEIIDQGADQLDWDRTQMSGNGPYMLESARSDQEIAVGPNPYWDGTAYDEVLELPEQPYLDRLTFRVGSDIDASFNAFEAGEVDSGPIPPTRLDAVLEYPNVRDIQQLATYYFQIGEDSLLQGEENLLLRRAIALAIDREQISEEAWDGAQDPATGMVPPGVDGYEEGMCELCERDVEAAEAAYQDWLAEGNEEFTLQITYNEGAGHDESVDIMIDNLAEIGIQTERNGRSTETYFDDLAEGACVDICRVGWFSDWPAQDSFLYDLFHSDSLGGNNYGYQSSAYDDLVDEAKRTVDDEARFDLFHQAEQLLLNEDIGVYPIVTYAGQYVFQEGVEFPYTIEGDVIWEQVRLEE